MHNKQVKKLGISTRMLVTTFFIIKLIPNTLISSWFLHNMGIETTEYYLTF